MFRKIAVWLGKSLLIFLVVFGLTSAIAVGLFAKWLVGGDKVKPVPAVVVVEPVPLALAAPAVDALPDACLCVDNLVCIGPKGGRYCLTDAGKKKYL